MLLEFVMTCCYPHDAGILILTSRSIRAFDKHATVIVGKYETVDTYYRCCSSANFVGKVSVPLLCISSLDDPLCTKEAIPWDECRLNKNIILATTKHGGHLAFFEGVTASSLWWVRAANEFLCIFNQSPYAHTKRKIQVSAPTEPSIDHGPFVNVAKDGMLAAMVNEQTTNTDETNSGSLLTPDVESNQSCSLKNQEELTTESTTSDAVPMTEQVPSSFGSNSLRRRLDQLFKHSRRSMWLLIYISFVSSWPLLSSALHFFFKKKLKGVPPSTVHRR